MTAENGQVRMLHGIGVSAGIVLAPSWSKRSTSFRIPDKSITRDMVPAEIARLDKALEQAKSQLENIQNDMMNTLGEQHAQLLDFHIMMLEDEELRDSITSTMENQLCCVEKAVDDAVEKACAKMLANPNTYWQERAADIQDVGSRIIRNLLGESDIITCIDCSEPVILLADDLTPTETAHLDTKQIAAFVTRSGSRTSHTAILARALGIPAIVATQESIDNIEDGTLLALDAGAGTVIVAPDISTIEDYRNKDQRQRILFRQISSEAGQPAETLDGYQASLVANVELPSEALKVKKNYNVGIGLFRTEFLFIEQGSIISEEEQFQAYKDTVTNTYPHSVIFRTLDIGGDKFLTQIQLPREINPFMGTRAIRFSLRRPDIFKTQLRAILRASAFGKVRLMFPMISAVEEIMKALEYLEQVKSELREAGIPFNENMDVGCMIEVPSAALLAERLIQHLDFFSIGTNDLVQYSLAVDRGNPEIAYLYQPAHPAVIRQIKYAADCAAAKGKWVSVCGEMAGETLYTPLLLGMGIQELSMSPVALASVHKLIRNIRMHDAEVLVAEALKCNNGAEVEVLCRNFIAKSCPELLDA